MEEEQEEGEKEEKYLGVAKVTEVIRDRWVLAADFSTPLMSYFYAMML